MPDAAGALPVNAIEINGLTKVYGRNGGTPPALGDVSLTIPRGAFFGLLGPNGAGKSTLINILAGLVIKTAGSARVWGFDIDSDPRQARASIGVVPQELLIDPFFTAREALELQAGFFAVPKAERRTAEILEALGLSGVANSYARRLSGGMRRRLLVAKALVHAPPILVLDEPTAGVDVDLRHQLWSYVQRLNAAGTTILLTTHYLEEAEQLCDRIAILHRGAVVACATPRRWSPGSTARRSPSRSPRSRDGCPPRSPASKPSSDRAARSRCATGRARPRSARSSRRCARPASPSST